MEEHIRLVLEDYGGGRPIDASSGCFPDSKSLSAWIGMLRGILFPGYFTGSREALLDRAQEELHLLLQAVLCREEAECTAKAFFSAIPHIRATVQTDLQAAFDGDPAATGPAEIILAYPGFFAVSIYRLAHVLYDLGIPLLPRMMTEHAHSLTGIDIHPGARIGPYFFIDHGTGVVVGQTTVIGAHVKLYQGVTLGALTTRGGQDLREKKRHPTIEDRVTIYANASILGGDTVIGHHCVIGASAFITESVPPCTTASMKDRQLCYHERNCPGCERSGQNGL